MLPPHLFPAFTCEVLCIQRPKLVRIKGCPANDNLEVLQTAVVLQTVDSVQLEALASAASLHGHAAFNPNAPANAMLSRHVKADQHDILAQGNLCAAMHWYMVAHL